MTQVSIIMPVFNSGLYLEEAVNSVLAQRSSLDKNNLPSYELILIDDHSTDPLTRQILHKLSTSDDRVIVIVNSRSKGAAGARNTGILKSKGQWIAFLDSDDIWFQYSLATRWEVILKSSYVRWVAANFQLLRSPLAADISVNTENIVELGTSASHAVTRLEKPINQFCDDCFIGIMTVLIRKDLIIEKLMFDERLPRSEDYHLWFKCALDSDLYMVITNVAYYRIHSSSLTHGNKPRFMHEEEMLELILQEPLAHPHKRQLMRRFDMVMQDHCYFYRRARLFSTSFQTALKWAVRRPWRLAPYKEMAAAIVRIH